MNKSVLFIAFAAVLLSFISFKSPLFGDDEEGRLPYGYPDSTVKAILPILEKEYSSVPYFCKFDDQYLFYVCKGNWPNTKDSLYPHGNFLMGIFNNNKEEILPAEYNKIYNPDATCKGYIEIEKNNKKGLVNYHTKKIIKAEYDVIYPHQDWNSIAIGKIGSLFYEIFPDGRKILIDHYYPINGILNNWTSLDVPGGSLLLLYEAQLDSTTIHSGTATGIVVKPSYLNCLAFIPEIQYHVSLGQDHYSGITNLKSRVTNNTTHPETDIWTMFASFSTYGIEDRGYLIEQNYLISMSNKGDFKDSQLIYDNSVYNYYYFSDRDTPYEENFPNDSLAELVVMTEGKEYSKYKFLPHHFYYKISKNGEIKKLESNRIFNFTQYILINEEQLKGSYIKDYDDHEYEKANTSITDYLDMEDLDLMRNEIYADYGYIFKTEKWQKYFEAKQWYKPLYNDVEKYMTEIDKKNIKFIVSMQNELKKDEKKYTNPHNIVFQYQYEW